MSQYPASIDLSTLDGTNGFTISGVGAYDYSGDSVASAGDVNGDGFLDLIVGAFGAHPHGPYSGASYVVFGSASGFGANLDLSTLNGANGFKISGVSAGDISGRTVASAGDVNGDGFDDVIVSAIGGHAHGPYTGASYVVFGKASGFSANFNLSGLNGANGFKITGVAAYDYSGSSVSSAGDINGDGFADLIVGARGASASASSYGSGVSYVVFGKAGGFGANLNLSSLNGTNGFKITGEATYDHSGQSVSSAGDVNGDGFADLFIGAPYASPYSYASGASYVVFGKAGGFGATFDLSTLDGTNGFRISGEASKDLSGRSVAQAGDVNGDGFSDLIIGAVNGDSGAGASYVVFGKASGFGADVDLSTLDGTNGFKIGGGDSYSHSGYAVASAGDVNGDGFDDLIVSALGSGAPSGAYTTAAAYVVFGKASGFDPEIDLSSLDGTNGFKIDGASLYEGAGLSVASAGDLNGDGLADLIIGSPHASPHGDYSGVSYVVYGRLPDAAVDRTGTDAPQSLVGGDFNDTLSGLGGADKLYGHGGDDVLDGGTGADTMIGGTGNDTYYVDNPGDVIVEKASEGHDLVYSSITFTLPAYAEDLTLTGTGDIDGAGNIQSNIITGNDGANTLSGDVGNDALYGAGGADTLIGGGGADRLDGGTGADSLSGGVGNDTYFVDDPGDLVIENPKEGTDTVNSTISYTLTANVENLTLAAGAGDIDGTGNDLANTIVGNEGANVIAGGLGNDTLTGGSGADTFLFDTALNKTANVDTVTDFTEGDDSIELDHAIFAALATGPLDPSAFHLGKTAVTAAQHVLYDPASGNLAYDADGHGGAGPVLFAHLAAGLAMTAADFVVI